VKKIGHGDMANLQWCQRATMARQAVAAGGKEGAQ